MSDVHILQMNIEQKTAYQDIFDSVTRQEGNLFFLNRPTRTGKTFLYNTLAMKVCTHSMFKIFLDINDDSSCSINKNSDLADLLQQTSLIIWDEIPMQYHNCAESVDHTLQDICDDPHPFRGITVVFGSDFCQILPIITKGS
ncbi:19949_t:CDS:2 [Cetraspora pellucida]|uniref:ATP-dependent DNA helicase n=1 Tax=Cetraspora pellucida TaxID=1433469 RepID=A0A9N9E364_9GLOM|nr:19949_t:CDS:2 [Cetraspora pellucida]